MLLSFPLQEFDPADVKGKVSINALSFYLSYIADEHYSL